jgi:hypothetical protein
MEGSSGWWRCGASTGAGQEGILLVAGAEPLARIASLAKIQRPAASSTSSAKGVDQVKTTRRVPASIRAKSGI